MHTTYQPFLFLKCLPTMDGLQQTPCVCFYVGNEVPGHRSEATYIFFVLFCFVFFLSTSASVKSNANRKLVVHCSNQNTNGIFPLCQFPFRQFPLCQFPLCQFPLCQFPFGQYWQRGNWQSGNSHLVNIDKVGTDEVGSWWSGNW